MAIRGRYRSRGGAYLDEVVVKETDNKTTR
jgi:hypothetical protein